MHFDGHRANSITCWAEDDGEWTIPDEVWDYQDGGFPTSGTITLDRLNHCWFPVEPDVYVKVAVETDVSTWIEVLE